MFVVHIIQRQSSKMWTEHHTNWFWDGLRLEQVAAVMRFPTFPVAYKEIYCLEVTETLIH